MNLAVPFGLVEYVCQAFEKQMRHDGVIIIGDVGINDPGISLVHEVMTTGIGAKYKGIDFVLADWMLKARGFKTEVLSIPRSCQACKYEPSRFGKRWARGD